MLHTISAAISFLVSDTPVYVLVPRAGGRLKGKSKQKREKAGKKRNSSCNVSVGVVYVNRSSRVESLRTLKPNAIDKG